MFHFNFFLSNLVATEYLPHFDIELCWVLLKWCNCRYLNYRLYLESSTWFEQLLVPHSNRKKMYQHQKQTGIYQNKILVKNWAFMHDKRKLFLNDVKTLWKKTKRIFVEQCVLHREYHINCGVKLLSSMFSFHLKSQIFR